MPGPSEVVQWGLAFVGDWWDNGLCYLMNHGIFFEINISGQKVLQQSRSMMIWPWSKSTTTKIRLGDMYDLELDNSIDAVLKTYCSEKRSEMFDVSGFCETSIYSYLIVGKRIYIIWDSDNGVTIKGDKKLVEDIVFKIREKLSVNE